MVFHCSFLVGSYSQLACNLAKQKIESAFRLYKRQPAQVDLTFHSEGKSDYVELLVEEDPAFRIHLLGQGKTFQEAVDDVVQRLKAVLLRRRKRWRAFAREVEGAPVWELAALGVCGRQVWGEDQLEISDAS